MMETGIPSLLMQAAQTAAQADGLTADKSLLSSMQQISEQELQAPMVRKAIAPSASNGGGKKKGLPLRRGKWTAEEEAYANRLIQEFKAGLLPLTDGTTLRTFLSKLLNCDPMRISKKFVGSNCIGKQVFRRRTADLNRLTPEQIQKSRAELSELERRFLDRVAQTNRVKSSGVGGGGAANSGVHHSDVMDGLKKEDISNASPPSPPWLQVPLGYKQGGGAAMAAANLAGADGNRAAAAGRALLQGLNPDSFSKQSSSGLTPSGSAGLLAMAELQRRVSHQNLLNSLGGQSTQNLLAALNSNGVGESSMASLARSASAARLAQLAKERGLSSTSLTNMLERKNSYEALMSLDFQSLQSIDNLANLIQNGGSSSQTPSSGLRNWSASGDTSSKNSLAGLMGTSGSSGSLAKRLASTGQMESLLRTLSSNNMKGGATGQSSSSNLQGLLQNMQGGAAGTSMSSLLGNSRNAASAASLANLLRENSSTGLSALRMQDGLNNRNSSVDDFLSLVAAGDIPHQDPSLLNVPLMHHQRSGTEEGGGNRGLDAVTMLAQQRLLAQATGNPALANALASRSLSGSNLRNLSASNLRNLSASNLRNFSSSNLRRNGSGSLRNSDSAAALLANAADTGGATLALKRKLLGLDSRHDEERPSKR